jgi:hypothetical protein
MIQGTRRDLADDSIFPNPGEYGKRADGAWYGCIPVPIDANGFPLIANLSNHQINEHGDGTISVSPSILTTSKHRGLTWHGYLERGVWREV